MKILPTNVPDVVLLEPKVFGDARGFFVETYREEKLQALGFNWRFVQDNHSRSIQGVLRGLHYQIGRPQGKLVHVVRGEIFDVAVDIRRDSRTFGRWVGMKLDDKSLRQVYIPPGFAHGFCVLSEIADVVYKCSDFYSPGHELTILWNDPEIGIDWPISEPLLSEKDLRGTPFDTADLS